MAESAFGTTVLRVWKDATGTPTANPTTWDDSYTDLQAAIDAAVVDSDYEIWVIGGTELAPIVYSPGDPADPSTITNRNLTFNLKSGVRIYGGFQTSHESLEEARPLSFVTILSGEIHTGVSTDNLFHVVTADGTGAGTLLDGFTIRRGSFFTDCACGAGLLVTAESELTIRNCRVTDNEAFSGGGAHVGAGGALTIEDSVFDANEAKYTG